jgi:hypothetical protein
MSGQRVRSSKVFRASWATRAESISNLKLFLDVDPFRVFEVHITTSDKERLTSDMVTLPMPLKVMRILASHKVACTIFNGLHETTLVGFRARGRGDGMWAAEWAVLCFDF